MVFNELFSKCFLNKNTLSENINYTILLMIFRLNIAFVNLSEILDNDGQI
jgi:hypothetical protein